MKFNAKKLSKVVKKSHWKNILYINLKEIGQQLSICHPSGLNSKAKRLEEIRDILEKSGISIIRATKYMRRTSHLKLGMIFIVKHNSRSCQIIEKGYLERYIVLPITGKILNDLRTKTNLSDKEKARRLTKNLKCIMGNKLGKYTDYTARFVSSQLIWITKVFPNLTFYAISPISLSETIDAVHFILIEDDIAEPEQLIKDVREYFLEASKTVLEVISELRWDMFLKHALRSAIAAIMGRNMSHNVGSHAIWYLAERLKGSMVYSNDDKIENFLRYLQRRMDFIAQVSTSAPSWCLNISWRGLLKGFTEQRCLLDNIARSHLQDPNNSSEEIFEKKLKLNVMGKGNEKFDVAIPHGQVGAQAFYVILEGLIRNAAKHGEVMGKLEFTITIEDQWDDNGRGWQKDFYRVKISDNLTTSQKVVTDLNKKLAQTIINPNTGEIKTGDWGMKEIKICAAYLRMIKQEEIDTKFKRWKGSKGEKPPVVEVTLENKRKEKNKIVGNLTYVLYLLRPKEALIVGIEPQESQRDTFRQKGIDFLPKFENLRQQIDAGDIPRHNFLVLKGEQVDWKWLRENLASLPYRVLIVGENTIPDDKDYEYLNRIMVFVKEGKLSLNTPEELLCCLWKEWVETWWGKYKICVRWEKQKFDKLKEHEAAEEYIEEGNYDPCPECRYLTFDHKKKSDTTNLFRYSAFHQSFTSDSPIVNLLKGGNRYLTKEIAAISVAVIDERIWLERDGEAAEGVFKYKYSENKKRIKAWEKRRVYLQNTDEAIKRFENFVNEQLKPPNEDPYFDFIIIHQGIIDEVKKQLGDGRFSEAWENLKRKARWVIIDTGRGEPETARNERLRWVEYSNLAECLVQRAGDKVTLANLLWSLRFTKGG